MTGLSNHAGGRTAADTEADVANLRPHVLILDDQEASRALCADYCDLFDHTSESFGSGAEALAALKRQHFDVVVMNLHMEGCDGLRALDAIRALPGAGEAPIVGLTAVGRGDEAQRWLAAGLSAVVAKPVTAARLYAALGAAVEPGADAARSWAPAQG